MHTAEKEVYNVECVFLFQVHLRIKYDTMSFVCNKLSVLHEGHSRCGKVSKWTDLSFHTEVRPKQAFSLRRRCGGCIPTGCRTVILRNRMFNSNGQAANRGRQLAAAALTFGGGWCKMGIVFLMERGRKDGWGIRADIKRNREIPY